MISINKSLRFLSLFFLFSCGSGSEDDLNLKNNKITGDITRFESEPKVDFSSLSSEEWIQVRFGDKARPGQFKYHVTLHDTDNSSAFCGGVILNKDTVLTAAHCLMGKDSGKVDIGYGSTQILNQKKVAILGVIPSGNPFTDKKLGNDIIKLKTEPMFASDQFVGVPISVDSLGKDETLTFVGFGTTEHGILSNDLRYTYLNRLDDNYCESKSGTTLAVDQFCAGDKKYRRSSPCHGDSGGALVATTSQNLVGLLSWSQGCAGPHQPSYFTDTNLHTF